PRAVPLRNGSEVTPQVHPAVERCDLVSVAVEHQRLAAPELANASLTRLTPAGMIDLRVHVRVEPVLARVRSHPGRARLLLDKADAYDGLDALEAILPRHDESQRCTVLVRQVAPVEAGDHERERMHGLVQPEPLHVRPVEDRHALAR